MDWQPASEKKPTSDMSCIHAAYYYYRPRIMLQRKKSNRIEHCCRPMSAGQWRHLWHIMSVSVKNQTINFTVFSNKAHFSFLYSVRGYIAAISSTQKPHVILTLIYTVFHKKTPFCFFHNSLKWWSIYTKFVPVVAEKILIQNIATKCGSWLNIPC